MNTAITNELWAGLDEMRRISRLILVALEEDDLDRVQALARRSSELTALVERELGDAADADGELAECLFELSRMNGRIVEVLRSRRDEARDAMAEARRRRFQVVGRQIGCPAEAAFVNRHR
ncbi:MAG: hypothetical protein R3F20_07470 [Planctomycetota bacterium]